MEIIFREIFNKYHASSVEGESFKLVHQFLTEFPASLSLRKKVKPSVQTEEGLRLIGKHFFEGRRYLNLPNPTTKTDKAVSTTLVVGYGFDESSIEEVLKNHQYAMIAENNVGNYLERYVADNIESLGWAWCSGDLVKSIDFILRTPEGWVLLQIKNRNTSENSSSSAVRIGTSIKKWHRYTAKSGKTRWEKFPHISGVSSLSEAGFLEFIQMTIQQFRTRMTPA